MIGALRRRLRLRTRSPFLWLLVTPLATLPLSALLLFTVGGAVDAQALGLTESEWVRADGRLDYLHYFYFDFWLTWLLFAAPGALNLAAAWWLFHELAYVRLAAAIAMALALLRTFAVPVAAILWLTGDVAGVAGGGERLILIPISEHRSVSGPSPTLAAFNLLGTAWAGGMGMWLVTFGLLHAYEPLMVRLFPRLQPPRERDPDEPRSWGGFYRRR